MAGKSLAKVMPEYVKDRDPREFALFKTLVYGSLREWPRLQGLLKQLMAKPLKEKDRDIAALLALGIHQLSELRIPPHAAVSETVFRHPGPWERVGQRPREWGLAQLPAAS